MTHMIATSILHLRPELDTLFTVTFVQLNEDDDHPRFNHVYTYDRESWNEMGNPVTITLTVNPGDHLDPPKDKS